MQSYHRLRICSHRCGLPRIPQNWAWTSVLHPAYRAALADPHLMLRVAAALAAGDARLGQRQLCSLLSAALQTRSFGPADRARMEAMYRALPVVPGAHAALLLLLAHARLGETAAAHRLWDDAIGPMRASLSAYAAMRGTGLG
jgi:hypothetical protein